MCMKGQWGHDGPMRTGWGNVYMAPHPTCFVTPPCPRPALYNVFCNPVLSSRCPHVTSTRVYCTPSCDRSSYFLTPVYFPFKCGRVFGEGGQQCALCLLSARVFKDRHVRARPSEQR